jgi:hypothetical protein
LSFFAAIGVTPRKFMRAQKSPGLGRVAKKTGIARTALLATCLTWLQAGRPNHHEAGLMSRGGARVKGAMEKAIPLVNPGEKGKVRVTDAPADAKKMTHGAGK